MHSTWHALLQDVELMPQYQDFGFQSPSRLEAIARHAGEKEADSNHAGLMFGSAGARESNGLGFRKRQPLVPSRPAKVGDKLVTTKFNNSIPRGFAAIGEPTVAVCLLPGTEIAFETDIIEYRHAL